VEYKLTAVKPALEGTYEIELLDGERVVQDSMGRILGAVIGELGSDIHTQVTCLLAQK